jgi:hypothetical protein
MHGIIRLEDEPQRFPHPLAHSINIPHYKHHHCVDDKLGNQPVLMCIFGRYFWEKVTHVKRHVSAFCFEGPCVSFLPNGRCQRTFLAGMYSQVIAKAPFWVAQDLVASQFQLQIASQFSIATQF